MRSDLRARDRATWHMQQHRRLEAEAAAVELAVFDHDRKMQRRREKRVELMDRFWRWTIRIGDRWGMS